MWLTRRGSVFYLRAPVPKDIRDTFGKTEVVFSLWTSDLEEARRLINAKAQTVQEQFEDHRQLCVASVWDSALNGVPHEAVTGSKLESGRHWPDLLWPQRSVGQSTGMHAG